jgi:hypothetical protein
MSSDMKTKTTSAWIMHVKKFAKDNNLKYNEALRDPNLKVGYVKVERVKSKSSPKIREPVMELNRNYDKVEPVMKVKKQRKTKDDMLGPSLLVVEPKPMIITESGNLEMKMEPTKVKVKRSKKKDVMM